MGVKLRGRGGSAEKGLLRYIWVLLNITRVCETPPSLNFGFSRTTPSYRSIRESPTRLPTPLNLALADDRANGRYGYYGTHWLMAFLRAFR